jgi:hypothetical protein
MSRTPQAHCGPQHHEFREGKDYDGLPGKVTYSCRNIQSTDWLAAVLLELERLDLPLGQRLMFFLHGRASSILRLTLKLKFGLLEKFPPTTQS